MNEPNVFAIAEHMQELGKRPLSTVLLQREALAWGLTSLRTSPLDFVVYDSLGTCTGFNRTGSVLNSRPCGPVTKDKHTTRLLLQRAGIPVPSGRRFRQNQQNKAVEFASSLKYPVVLKPLHGTEGKGVVTGIHGEEDLRWAFEDVARSSYTKDDILIEEHLEGETYRIIVLDGRALSVLISRRGKIVGDGVHTVRQLVEQRQSLRAANPHLMGRPIAVDERMRHLLRRQGADVDTVLAEGASVYFTFGSNTHQGGEPEQVIDQVHPSILDASVAAVQCIPGLGWAGVDFIIPDISIPLADQRAGICEINSVPASDSHDYPLYGPVRPVTRNLFEGACGRAQVKLSQREEFQGISVTIEGKIPADSYSEWIEERASRMGLKLKLALVEPRRVEVEISGPVDLLSVWISLAFTGPRGAKVRCIRTVPVGVTSSEAHRV